MDTPSLATYMLNPVRLTLQQFAADVDKHLAGLAQRPIVLVGGSEPRVLLDARRTFEFAAALVYVLGDAMADPAWDMPSKRMAKRAKKR